MLKYLIEKEFRQFRRNSFLPKIVIAFPVVAMLVFPWVVNLGITDLNIAIVDYDRSSFSSRLVGDVSGSPWFNLTGFVDSYDDAIAAVERGDADIVLEIPHGFERAMMRGVGARVMISANSVNGTKGALGANYLQQIIGRFGMRLAENGMLRGAGGASGRETQAVIGIETRGLFNEKMDYKVFMVPALMVMLLTMLCGFLPALNIVSEKETGTIEQINVTPVNKFTFILSKLIPYWIIGFIVLTICFLIAWLVYGLVPAGNIGVLYLASLIFILVMSGMGLVISNSSATMQQAMFVMVFFVIILLLMSGLFTPVESMPRWAQRIAAFNPLKYFIEVMRMVYLKGSSLDDLGIQIGALTAFAVGLNLWAVASYRKNA